MENTIAEPNNKYFNPLAPRGARQFEYKFVIIIYRISIH